VRICIVTVAHHGLGGMQAHARALARGLVEAGHDVDVLTTSNPEGEAREERGGVTWHFLDAAHHHPRLPRRDPAWLECSYEAFVRLHRERPFDLIHSESTSAIGLVRKRVHERLPLVVKFHGNGIALARAGLTRARAGDTRVRVREAKGLVWLFAACLQYGQWYRFRPCVWMVPSREEFEDTRRTALLKASLGYVVPNGVDQETFRPLPRSVVRAELGLGDSPLFIAAGRLNLEKGMHHAVQALARLDGPRPAPRLVVVGEGEQRKPLERLARSLGLQDRVLFPGAKTHDDLARYFAAADVFLFPTERAEAGPLVLVEAMACGLPIIASAIGAIPELLGRTGQNGLLVPPGDTEALAEAMHTLLRDDELRRRLGEAAHRRALAEYTTKRMVDRTLDVYGIAMTFIAKGNDAQSQARRRSA
jgi:glycosyltransferase involved in cell wall biosynthesis